MDEELSSFTQGGYTSAEAARYTNVPAGTIRSWLTPRGASAKPVFRPASAAVDDVHVVSFFNLVEVYVGGCFRTAGVRTPALRRTHDLLRTSLGTPYPFAHADLPTRGRQSLVEAGGAELVAVAAAPAFFDRMRLDRFVYGQTTRLAREWRLGHGVAIVPGVAAGDPIVDGTGVKSYILAGHYHANGNDARLVADLFRVSEGAVLDAAAFEDGLGRRPAA